MSIKVQSWVSDGGPDDSIQRYVLKEIADFADDRGVAYPGVALLAEKTVQTERNILRVLKKLEQDGWIEIKRRCAVVLTERGHERKGNMYCINIQRVRERALEAQEKREIRRYGKRRSDNLSPDDFASEASKRFAKLRDDRVSPEPFEDNDLPEGDEDAVENPVEDVVDGVRRGDIHDIGEVTSANGEVTNAQRRGDTAGIGEVTLAALLNTKNHQGTVNYPSSSEPPVEPEAIPPTPQGVKNEAVSSELSHGWTALKFALKEALRGLPLGVQAGKGMREIRPGMDDYDSAFRDCWLLDVQQRPGETVFIAGASDESATAFAFTKYADRLQRLARLSFGLDRRCKVRFVLRKSTEEGDRGQTPEHTAGGATSSPATHQHTAA